MGQHFAASVSDLRRSLLQSGLLVLAGVGWWWTIVTSNRAVGTMGIATTSGAMSIVSFTVAWIAMMTAMMLPALLPVVRLYDNAAARGTVAPTPFFIAGYAVVWSIVGLPVFFVYRNLSPSLLHGAPTAGRLAGVALVGAGVYQVTPLKAMCLRHCRSPLNFFMRHAKNLRRESGALVLGMRHGLFCLGCCWMLMAVLVALGTMQLAWMAVVALLIFLEKAASVGELIAKVAGFGFFGLGLWLLIVPTMVGNIT